MSNPPIQRSEAPNALPLIEGYRIEGVLGRGTTGVVYSAVQIAVNRPVALKLLHKELMGNQRAVRRLQREARTAAKLAHPAIISAIDMGEADGRWWYAMELVEGISLGERLEEHGLLSEREALRFFIPVVEALQYACDAGVTHRDIKPANILVDPHDRARIVDLGLAIADDDPALTLPGGTLGTPHYISPEQTRDPSNADTRSDIWSLGATMYHALCGRPPFQGESVAEVLSAVLYQPVPDPRQFRPELSRGMVLVLRKCLTRDPQRRYAQPAQLGRDLDRLRERRAPEVQVSKLDPLLEDKPGRARMLGGGLLLLLLIGFVLRVFVWPGLGKPGPASPAPLAFEQLDELRASFAAREDSFRSALGKTGSWLSLRNSVPLAPTKRAAALEFQVGLLADLDGELAQLHEDMGLRFDGFVQEQSWIEAQELLLDVYPRELRRGTGFDSLAQMPDPGRVRRWEDWMARHRKLLSEELEAAYQRRSELALSYVTRELGPGVMDLCEQRRYVEALSRLNRPQTEWVTQARILTQGLDPELLQKRIHALAQPKLDELGRDVFQHWGRLDKAIETDLRMRAKFLRDRIAQDPGTDPVRLLHMFLEERLTLYGFSLDQVPVDWERGFVNVERGLGEDLAADQAAVWEQAARSELERDWEHAESLYQDRSYGELASQWRENLATSWRQVVHDQLRLLETEAAILEGFIESAARGIKASHSSRRGVYYHSIQREGRLDVAANPMSEGFRLLVTLGGGEPEELRFVLRRHTDGARDATLLAATDVEMFARLDPLLAEQELRDLQVALFRFHEGAEVKDLEALVEAKRAGPGQVTGDLSALWEMLAERLQVKREDAGHLNRQRRAELARDMIALQLDSRDSNISRKRLRAGAQRIRRVYRDLLSEEEIQALTDLLVVRAELEKAPDLRSVFPHARVVPGTVLGSSQAVDLYWDFDLGEPGRWQIGPYRLEAGHLVLVEALSGIDQLLSRKGAAILVLGDPLELGNRLRLTVEFVKPANARPKNEIMLTIGGYHLIFLDDKDAPGFLGGMLPLEELWRRAQAGDLGSFAGFSPLADGAKHTLVLEIDLVDGELRELSLGATKLRYPRTFSVGRRSKSLDPPTLEIRSLQEIEVHRVRIETNTRR